MAKKKNKDLLPGPEGYRDTALEQGLGKGSVGMRLVAGPLPMGSSWAQPEEATWVHPHVGPPPAGGAVKVRCSGHRWHWDMERHLSDGEGT